MQVRWLCEVTVLGFSFTTCGTGVVMTDWNILLYAVHKDVSQSVTKGHRSRRATAFSSI